MKKGSESSGGSVVSFLRRLREIGSKIAVVEFDVHVIVGEG